MGYPICFNDTDMDHRGKRHWPALTHIDKHVVYTNFYALPAILVYVFALLDKRKNFYNGKMTYFTKNNRK